MRRWILLTARIVALPCALASKLKVYATATLLLVDAHGHERVPRLVGIDNLDFFSAYLDQSN